MTRSEKIAVVLEIGPAGRRVFASALDWPGWCRAAKDEAAALDALAAYATRYAPVATRAKLKFPGNREITVVERVTGNATTDFGAPSVPATAERAPTKAKAARAAALVSASWAELAHVAKRSPATLRKGPRGGGRDRDKMLAHVVEAEDLYYSRKLGVRKGTREDILAAIRAARPDTGWPALYAARRIAWHALDHAWEMQDRA